MNLREWALPIYTILMQLGIGTLLVLWTIRATILKQYKPVDVDRILRKPVLIIFITLMTAMLGSHMHLSNPAVSFLAILNLRHSWLSREIFFTVLTFLASFLLMYYTWFYVGEKQRIKTILGWGGVVMGVASIFSMSNCYFLPSQAAWNHPTTMLLFYCSMLILGAISAFTILVMDAIFANDHEPELAEKRYEILQRTGGKMVLLSVVIMVAIVGMNAIRIFGDMAAPTDELAQTTLTLLLNVYRLLFDMRFITLFAGIGLFALVVFWLVKKKKPLKDLVTPTYVTCLLLLMAEIMGRFLFYAAHVRLGI
ncbi:MAG: DmsC/YnfH family molybdoenzyme membrane anchor subunit [Anaerolineaceae bacterium]